MDLYNRLLTRNPVGLSHQDATQLLLWTFCTLDVPPPGLRHEELGRRELADIFSRRARAGKIKGGRQADIASPYYWNSCIDEFMSGRLQLEQNFPVRSFSFF